MTALAKLAKVKLGVRDAGADATRDTMWRIPAAGLAVRPTRT